MKTKKLIALILLAVLACFSLASCKEEVVGDYIGHYDWWKPEVIVELNYDLYIISDCDDSEEAENAKSTVQAKINQILDEKYHTTVTIHYISADEYAASVDSVVSNLGGKGEAASGSRINAGSIVLVAGKEMYDSLMEKGALVDIRACLDTTSYGKLNTQLTPSLLDSAKVTNEDGVEQLFMIPNDHVIGEYTYTVIDRSIAEGQLNFSAQTELHEMLVVNGQPNEIAQELITSIETNLPGTEVSTVIREVKGAYEYKAFMEAQGYICNISAYPEVTPEETFTAGFAILTQPEFDFDLDENADTTNASFLTNRAMDVIYSINADREVRNLLQYGVEHTNYTFEEKTVLNNKGEEVNVKYVVPLENNAYKMNLLYTGDMFNAYYCESNIWTNGDKIGAWTYEIVTNGDKQNSESFVEK